jgi:hypothetical protein
VLVTRTVQLDPDRNPGWTEADVEAELRARIGVEQVVWLPRGLTKDYSRFGTRGHVDIVAAFVRPGVVVAHRQPDAAHPDHAVTAEIIDLLRSTTDARGRRLEVVEIDAPTVTEAEGDIVDWSYINPYVCNGAVILCSFDDPRDAEAAATLSRLYPGREIVLVDARRIFAAGGGIHCITQQQPDLTLFGCLSAVRVHDHDVARCALSNVDGDRAQHSRRSLHPAVADHDDRGLETFRFLDQTRGGILEHHREADGHLRLQLTDHVVQHLLGDADRVDVPALRAATFHLLAGVA